ncbi:MAG: peptidoglycan DD-metalloendopeptidase family protein [bacterium]|nr:peptidoglycan DD-metalloendopeptidase family protein [bacterium]
MWPYFLKLTNVTGHPLLRKAAADAVKKWIYNPYILNGVARQVKFTAKVSFSLPENKRKKREPLRKYVGEPMDFKFKDAALPNVVKVLESMSGVIIELDPGVSNILVTCDFKQTPWDKALRLILRLNGLEMVQKKKSLWIGEISKKSAAKSFSGKKYKGEPIDLHFKNADLKNVLAFFGHFSKSTISIDPGIDGQLSFKLDKMPWDEALDLIMETNDLYMTKDSGNIRIRKKTRLSSKASAAVPDIWPTTGYVTDTFGFRLHPITKKRNFHNGIDIAAPLGNDVIAAADGEVTLTKFGKFRGNTIIIDHRNGYSTIYSQLKSFKVKKGTKVKKSALIGLVGSSGRSTAPHLHWEVHLNGKPIDAMTLIKD